MTLIVSELRVHQEVGLRIRSKVVPPVDSVRIREDLGGFWASAWLSVLMS